MRSAAVVRVVVRWFATAVPVVFVVSLLTFLLVSLTPGDAARRLVGPKGTAEQYEAVRARLGLDRPVWEQYWSWLTKALQGDLGKSLLSGEPVTQSLQSRAPVTVALIAGALIAAVVIGVGLGVLSAVRGGRLGGLVDVVSLLGLAVPSFWLGLILIALFAIAIPIFPAGGYVRFGQDPPGWAAALVLPVLTLALGSCAGIAKQTRDAMLDQLGQEYVFVLRTHGLSERSVLLRHAFRNAAIPVLTLAGLILVGLLSGTVLVESVFVLPGLGGLAVQATLDRDLPVIQGVAVLFTLVIVTVNLVVDLGYGLLNPKARA